MNEKEAIDILENFSKHHHLSQIYPGFVGYQTCTCGASWRRWYSAKGLECVAENGLAEKHDEEAAKLPRCKKCGYLWLATDFDEHNNLKYWLNCQCGKVKI